MNAYMTFTCGECLEDYDEEDDAKDCCDERYGGAERLAERIARRKLEAAGQQRLFDADAEARFERSLDRFIKTNQHLFKV